MYRIFKYIVIPKAFISRLWNILLQAKFWLTVCTRFIAIVFRGKPCYFVDYGFNTLYNIHGCPATLYWEIRNPYLIHISGIGYISPETRSVKIANPEAEYKISAFGINGKRYKIVRYSNLNISIAYKPNIVLSNKENLSSAITAKLEDSKITGFSQFIEAQPEITLQMPEVKIRTPQVKIVFKNLPALKL